MDSVYLRVSTLEKLVLELKHHQLDLVCLSVLDADPEDSFSATLSVEGINSVRPAMTIDVDGLESDPAVARVFESSAGFTNLT